MTGESGKKSRPWRDPDVSKEDASAARKRHGFDRVIPYWIINDRLWMNKKETPPQMKWALQMLCNQSSKESPVADQGYSLMGIRGGKHLIRITGLARSTLFKYLKNLEERGWIVCTRRGGMDWDGEDGDDGDYKRMANEYAVPGRRGCLDDLRDDGPKRSAASSRCAHLESSKRTGGSPPDGRGVVPQTDTSIKGMNISEVAHAPSALRTAHAFHADADRVIVDDGIDVDRLLDRVCNTITAKRAPPSITTPAKEPRPSFDESDIPF